MTGFLSSISSVVVIVLIMLLGYILRRQGWFADSFAGNISKLITQIALPASIFISVQNNLTRDSLVNLFENLLVPFIGVVISYIIAVILVKIIKVQVGRRGVFINTVANANTIFIGMPLNVALFGNKAMPYFLVYYIINTVSTWAFGVFLIQSDDPELIEEEKKEHKIEWKKLLPMPLVGFIVAIIWPLTGLKLPTFASQTFTYVGNLVTPLSLIYIGIVLADSGIKNVRIDKDSLFALIGRFIVAPAIIILLVRFCAPAIHLPMPALMDKTFIVQSGTPALAVLPVLANEAHGDVDYATNVVVLSTLLFIVVVPILMVIAG
ncbi:AEC family transporter [Lactobacillus xujianguonis]|uniref:AEC family transporter n=1 Tax=Lactobacillus xujianguonis TaxID=2495899 RepID=UPI000FDABB3B|nr:AEC family transporter [Lactobacillus xujianguonis]RVU72298.1 AEC family transporter [Lactobacillus xujianguonis]